MPLAWAPKSKTEDSKEMAISLYDISVTNFLQALQGVAGFLDKAKAHFEAAGTDLNEIVEARIHPDMWPLRNQIVSAVHHSLGAIQGVQAGSFSPPSDKRPHDYAGLQQIVADARATLKAFTPEEINALEGKDMIFALGDMKLPFTAENFIMSFSTPNLHFHATTAYDILRGRGAPVGKRDYMGPLRLKK
jgi:uncharacterized protein